MKKLSINFVEKFLDNYLSSWNFDFDLITIPIREMERDDAISSALTSRMNGLLARKYRFVSLNNNKKLVKQYEEMFSKINLKTVFKNQIKSLYRRHTHQEILYDDNLKISAFQRIPNHYFEWDCDNNRWVIVANFTDLAKGTELPAAKFLHSVNDPDIDTPEGYTMFESLIKLYQMKLDAQTGLMNVINKYAEIIPWQVFDSSLPPEQIEKEMEQIATIQEIAEKKKVVKAISKSLMSNLSGGNADKTFGFITFEKLRTDLHQKLIDAIDGKIAKLILGGTLTQEVGAVGSYAASNTHQEVREEIIDSDAEYIADNFQDVIRYVGIIHGLDWEDIYLEFYSETDEVRESEIFKANSDAIKQVSDAGYEIEAEEVARILKIDKRKIKKKEVLTTPIIEFSEKKNKKLENFLIRSLGLSNEFNDNIIELSSEITGEMADLIKEELKKITTIKSMEKLSFNLPEKFRDFLILSELQGRINAAKEKGQIEFEDKINPFEMPFEDAINYFGNLDPTLFDDLEEITEEVIAKYFYIKESYSLTVTNKVYSSLLFNLKNGYTFKDWLSRLDTEIVENLGLAQNGYYLDNVFRTNIQTAYNSGRYSFQETLEGEIYYFYNAIDDGRTSDICLKLDGFTALRSDPVWRYIYAPNHYRCRSNVIAMTKEDLEEFSLVVSEKTDEINELVKNGLGDFKGNPASIQKSLEKKIEAKKIELNNTKKQVEDYADKN